MNLLKLEEHRKNKQIKLIKRSLFSTISILIE